MGKKAWLLALFGAAVLSGCLDFGTFGDRFQFADIVNRSAEPVIVYVEQVEATEYPDPHAYLVPAEAQGPLYLAMGQVRPFRLTFFREDCAPIATFVDERWLLLITVSEDGSVTFEQDASLGGPSGSELEETDSCQPTQTQ